MAENSEQQPVEQQLSGQQQLPVQPLNEQQVVLQTGMTQPTNQRTARPPRGRKSPSPVPPQKGHKAASPSVAPSPIDPQQTGQQAASQQNEQQTQPPSPVPQNGHKAASPSVAPSPIDPQQTGQQAASQQNEQQPIAQQPAPPQSQGQASPQHLRRQWLAWTGFSGKTFWDVLDLFSKLAIPLVVVLATNGFTIQQADLARQQHNTEQLIAQDNQRATTLQTYINNIEDLLLNHNLLGDSPKPTNNADEVMIQRVRDVARARTLTALPGLDPKRKGALLQFLYETKLINGPLINVINQSIIDLSGADLSGVDLQNVDLNGINLYKAHLNRANLSGDFLWNAILQNADLSDADLSGANLNGAFLWETVLPGAKLDGATLVKANLWGADLNGADLNGADLSGAYLLYTQLTYRCVEKGQVQEGQDCNKQGNEQDVVKADLSGAQLIGAYLGGANLQGANLRNADLTRADLTGINPTDVDHSETTGWGDQVGEAKKIQWEVRNDGHTLWIAHKKDTSLPLYGRLDLHTGALQLWYDTPEEKKLQEPWGTALILLPSLWTQDRVPCQTNSYDQASNSYYCQGQGQDDKPVEYEDSPDHYVQVTSENPIGQIKEQNLMLRFHGTIAGRTVTSTVTLYWPPKSNSISARVLTTVDGDVNNVKLDRQNHPEEAFQPIILSSMHISSAQWASWQAYADGKSFEFPSPEDKGNWIIQPQALPVSVHIFGLRGGKSSWEKKAPTVEVQLDQSQPLPVAGRILPSSDPNNDNVRFWCASDKVLDSWTYTLIVSPPEST